MICCVLDYDYCKPFQVHNPQRTHLRLSFISSIMSCSLSDILLTLRAVYADIPATSALRRDANNSANFTKVLSQNGALSNRTSSLIPDQTSQEFAHDLMSSAMSFIKLCIPRPPPPTAPIMLSCLMSLSLQVRPSA